VPGGAAAAAASALGVGAGAGRARGAGAGGAPTLTPSAPMRADTRARRVPGPPSGAAAAAAAACAGGSGPGRAPSSSASRSAASRRPATRRACAAAASVAAATASSAARAAMATATASTPHGPRASGAAWGSGTAGGAAPDSGPSMRTYVTLTWAARRWTPGVGDPAHARLGREVAVQEGAHRLPAPAGRWPRRTRPTPCAPRASASGRPAGSPAPPGTRRP
jgi:hypothetical protein